MKKLLFFLSLSLISQVSFAIPSQSKNKYFCVDTAGGSAVFATIYLKRRYAIVEAEDFRTKYRMLPGEFETIPPTYKFQNRHDTCYLKFRPTYTGLEGQAWTGPEEYCTVWDFDCRADD